jgi:hypothetical protein
VMYNRKIQISYISKPNFLYFGEKLKRLYDV